MSRSTLIKETNGRSIVWRQEASVGETESHSITYKEESVTTDPTRNPNVPSIFTRQIDTTNGQPSNIYRGPSSPNGIATVYIFDPGHGLPLRVEYSTDVVFPDLNHHDMIEVADELATFADRWSADVIFGSNGDIAEVA